MHEVIKQVAFPILRCVCGKGSSIMVKVFITGGTGFIGSRVVKQLVAQGHEVTALSRRTGSELDQLDVKVVQGSLSDLDLIASAAADADAVYHLGFQHDFSESSFEECCQQDVRVVKAIVGALSASGKLFVNTSGTVAAGDTGGALGKEDMSAPFPRAESEALTLKAGQDNIRAVALRLPPFVYTKGFSGMYTPMYEAAEQKGSSSYVGAGDNKLCVVHVDDAVRAYVSLLTYKEAHGVYNVAGQNGITGKLMAETIAKKLHCKAESVSLEEAQKLFGPVIAMVISMNNQADSSRAMQDLNWQPQHTNFQEEI